MGTTAPSRHTLTPEALEKLILQGKLNELVAAVQPLAENERKKLSSTAYTIYSIAKNKWEYRTIPEKHEALASKLNALNTKKVFKTAQCAILAVCPFSRVKSVNHWIHANRWTEDRDKIQESTLQILKDRKPSWLDEWVEYRLENMNSVFLWEFVRKLMDMDLIGKPASIEYVRSMSLFFDFWHVKKNQAPLPSLVERLLASPDVLEDIYRLFDIESSAFKKHYLETAKQKPENFQTWTAAVGILCESGHLDRQRILDESLKGLSGGFSELQLTGFIKVHDHLNPTDEEVYNRQTAYIDLLHIRISRVSDFVLKKLNKLARSSKLDAKSFLEHAPSIAELPTRGPVKAALKLVKRLTKKNKELFPLAYSFIYEALHHEAHDIQEMACELIEVHLSLVESDQKDALIGMIPGLSASIQVKLSTILGIEAAHNAAPEFIEEDLNRVLDSLSDLSPSIKKQFGLSNKDLLSQFPEPVNFSILDVSVLSTLKQIKPIQSLEELIDTIAHAIEIVDSPDEVERIMDGLSRLCDQKPEDFDVQTASLLKRVKNPNYSESQKELIPGWGKLSLAFQDLLLTWLTGKYHHSSPPYYYNAMPHFLLNLNRIRELTRRVYKRQTGYLFAAPTHEQGWIDPMQLVARLRHLDQDWKYSRRYDLTQALLRLAPDRRQEALSLSSNLPSPIKNLVQWALGSKEGPTSQDKQEYELWIAAGRARSPLASLAEDYKVFRVKDDLPDSALPAHYTWKSTLRYPNPNEKYNFPEIEISHNCGALPKESDDNKQQPKDLVKDVQGLLMASLKRLLTLNSGPLWKRIPTTSLHRMHRSMYYQTFSAWQINWMQYTWPLHTDSCFHIGIKRMLGRIDENTATTIPLFCYLEPAFHIYRPWTEMTQLAAWVGMVSKDAELQNTAIDAMIEAIADGRAYPDTLALVLSRLAEGGWLKLNRLASTLKQVAEVSELHQYVTCAILDQFIAQLPELPKGGHHILQLTHELHTALQRSAPEDTKAKLQKITGKGKAARLAKSICDCKGKADTSNIYLASVEGRLSLIDSLVPSN